MKKQKFKFSAVVPMAIATVAAMASAAQAVAPIANDDVAAVLQNAQNFPINVLANDTDPELGLLTIVGITQGSQGGTVTISNGTLVYTPAVGFTGVETFTYTIQDPEELQDTATVTATVSLAPDPADPIARPDIVSAVQTDQNVTFNVLANDTDAEGLPLTIVAVTQGSQGGTVINNGTTITYTPAFTFSGTETFTYTIRDAEGQERTTTVTVTVAPPPSTVNAAIAGNGYLDGARRVRKRRHTTFTAYNSNNLSGQVVYRDPVSRTTFRSTRITAVQAFGNTGRIFGFGSFDGGPEVGFVLTTVDQFPTNITRGDTFTLQTGAPLLGTDFTVNSFFNPGGSRVIGGFGEILVPGPVFPGPDL